MALPHLAPCRKYSLRSIPSSGKVFALIDRFLDTTPRGPKYLAREPIARIVRNSLEKGVALGHYDLRAWVIMPNHVHVLLRPKIDPSLLLRALKGVTAREANRTLGFTGSSFWQRESYDHWVRNDLEFDRIVRYIEHNPVKAGLVHRPDECFWSSARTSARATETDEPE